MSTKIHYCKSINTHPLIRQQRPSLDKNLSLFITQRYFANIQKDYWHRTVHIYFKYSPHTPPPLLLVLGSQESRERASVKSPATLNIFAWRTSD